MRLSKRTRWVILIVIGMVLLVVTFLVTSGIMAGSLAIETQQTLKMLSLGAVVADNLQDQFRKTGSFPTNLSEIKIEDESIFLGMGLNRSVLKQFVYSSQGKKFKLDYESKHWRFGFSSNGDSGVTMQPLTGKN